MPFFHAGGAAARSSNGLLPFFDDPASIKDILLRRIHDLDFTHFGSILAISSLLPATLRFLQSTWLEAARWIRRFFISEIQIPAADPINRSVGTWLLEHVILPRNSRFHTARTEISNMRDPGQRVKKSARSVAYLPHWENVWFFHRGRVFFVKRSMEQFSSAMSDPSYDGIGGEELCISCLGLRDQPIREFVEECKAFAEGREQFFVIIYSRDRFGLAWKAKYRKPLRGLETVHFDEGVKRRLVEDVRGYLDGRTRLLYQSRSMPYRRGYLFYGPPGTGKSSLSTAIAGEFGLDLYEVKVPSIANDGDLEQMFQEIPPRCIVLLEDIDAVWAGREMRTVKEREESPASNVTLSGLLNVLDGVGSQEGRVVIMTTNKPERLDPALIRPGRVDFKVYLGNISKTSACQMFLRMFSPDLLTHKRQKSLRDGTGSEVEDGLKEYVDSSQLRILAEKFASEVPEDTFTPSQLQGYFQLHLSSAVRAAGGIGEWVEREMGRMGEGGFEVC